MTCLKISSYFSFVPVMQIFGPNMLKWFCPTAVGHLGDGTQFPISND